MESMAAEEDFEPNQDSSFSEDEHLPRGGAVERPLTPGECPRCCVGLGLEVQEVLLGQLLGPELASGGGGNGQLGGRWGGLSALGGRVHGLCEQMRGREGVWMGIGRWWGEAVIETGLRGEQLGFAGWRLGCSEDIPGR